MRRKSSKYPVVSRHERRLLKQPRVAEPTDQALDDAIRRLREEVGELVDMERAAVRIEFKHKVLELRDSSVQWATGAALCVLGALCVTLSAVLVFSSVMPMWVAALLVGVMLIAGGGFALRARIKARPMRSTKKEKYDGGDAPGPRSKQSVSHAIRRAESVH